MGKRQIAAVKKFLEKQAEEKQRADEKKRQEAEPKQQPAESQPTGRSTSWGWLGNALNSIKTALTTPLSRNSTVKKDDSSSDSSSSSGGTEDNTNAPNSSTAPEEVTQTEETDNTPEASPTSEDPRDCQGEDIGGNGWRRRLIDQARMQANDVDSM